MHRHACHVLLPIASALQLGQTTRFKRTTKPPASGGEFVQPPVHSYGMRYELRLACAFWTAAACKECRMTERLWWWCKHILRDEKKEHLCASTRVGQNHICTVYVQCFWQNKLPNTQSYTVYIYGSGQPYTYMVLANPIYVRCMYGVFGK
jgi:hypothetical protein